MDDVRKEAIQVAPDTVGKQVATIPVALSTRFLEHFSEQLYSSPQKAFEELISNGWDAGADIVDVRVDEDLQGSNATMAVFDNGTSMDVTGLRDLWHIAFFAEGRPPETARSASDRKVRYRKAGHLRARRTAYVYMQG